MHARTRWLSGPLMLASFALGCAPSPPACDSASFAAFWSEFQQAGREGDVAAIQRRVRFPFETRGPMDGDPVLKHTADAFPALWAQLLEQDPGLQLEPETLRAYIARHDTAPADALMDNDPQARVADLVFSCDAGTWRLTMAYTTE